MKPCPKVYADLLHLETGTVSRITVLYLYLLLPVLLLLPIVVLLHTPDHIFSKTGFSNVRLEIDSC